MDFSKKSIATSIALIIGSAGIINTASAVTFTFQNNTTATQPGATLASFDANSEFHIVSPSYGGLADGAKDVFFGGEEWIFNGDSSGALMTGVANTDTNSGLSGIPANGNGDAFLTSGVAGFPVALTPGTVATAQQRDTILGGDFTLLAPLTGNIVGQTFGAAFINSGTTSDFTQAGVFTITMPVAYMQFADFYTFILGGDGDGVSQSGLLKCAANGPCPGSGLTFNGTADGFGNFNLWASHTATRDEISHQAVRELNFEWSLQGNYVTSAIPVPAAAWLFGSGLVAGMIGIPKRRKKSNLR